MDLYRLTIQDSQDSMQFDLLDAPIKIEDVEGAVDNTVLTGDIFTDYLFLKKRWEQKWAIMCKDEYERLRGFYTRQWSLATVPSVKVTQGYLENASWEGQIFYINAPYGGEISSLTRMTGDTFQQPDPSPESPQPVQTVTGTQTITINGQAFLIDLGAIELCKLGDAQDSIYFDGADWILRKENAKHYFDTASGTGSTWEGARHRMYFTNTWQTANGINFATHTDTLTPAQILADKFVSLSFDDLYNNGKDGIALSATTTLSIRNNNWNDATTARSEIEGTTMYYALATPTETTITDATLISQLNAIQAALQEGQNTVTVTANGSNLPAKTITLNGIAGREKPVLAQTNVRIGLSDGGVLNACECRQNVTLSMRETA